MQDGKHIGYISEGVLTRGQQKTTRGGMPGCLSNHFPLFFFRLERAEPARVLVVLLLEGLDKALLAADATLLEVRTEFFFAIISPPFN